MPSGMEMINLAMRASAFLWSLLVMALTGNMIDQWNRGNGGEVNYSLFVSIFGMLSLIYLIPASLGKFVIHPILPLVLDVLNLIFWFAGAVALAAGLNAHSCNNQNYLDNNHITQGSEKRCREGQASCAFLWFGFAAFAVSTALSAMGMKSGGGARSGGIKRGPAMSQV